ncbi:DUF916 and DUF3324 domain-containing protein [Enterococcus caccae]|uniref:Uncharacterized protein n=1 Tax=Enterococcus caccae ATCC BAA-1240 TaxID=1158612 RepID=R3X8Z3_9ENTE|nr:DUF916 and DUF3324 domain-containing protein [Enterococcus caccae]EOL50535.1 hypothetical protein UC7_00308 [Enterococcus caccae ATCC BAA-1240]EOT59249.1 hypothetical protein I580_02281 [Enterococcus caccae ATCC BAA-1240]OJG26698.1 hypothetical protein RU98_GL000488 [Enterococcus caccae]
MEKKRIYLGLLAILFLFLYPSISFAEEDTTNEISGFSYEILFPENQVDKEVGYYDLLMKAGQTQTIHLKVNNTSDQAMNIEIRINSAKTNGNGVIEYGPNELKKDTSLKYDLAEIIKGPDEVVIPANSSEVIAFDLTMPVTNFEGYVAGGIQLKPVLQEKQEQTEQNAIVNKFAFLIGVLLHESDVKKVTPELKLNDIALKLKEGSYTLFVNLSNTKGIFLENMTAKIRINEKGKTKNLFELQKNNMRMAPNSMINLPVFLSDKEITAGEYTANIQITTENGWTWTWVKNFTLSKVAAQKIKQPTQKKTPRNFNARWLIVIITLLTICFSIGLFIFKRKR